MATISNFISLTLVTRGWTNCSMWEVLTFVHLAKCDKILWLKETPFALMSTHYSSTRTLLYAFSLSCNRLNSQNISQMLHRQNWIKLMKVSTLQCNHATGCGMNIDIG
jgi:hypothetical protein